MKITVTGSTGRISGTLTKLLVAQGHSVTVVSSSADRRKEIEDMGAAAAIGTLEDIDFLTAAFTGADAVYCMVPPNNFFDHSLDVIAYYRRVGENYAQAIRQAGVKRVVHLSSIGAHMESGSGIIMGHYYVEQALRELVGVAVTHMRPVYFYYNLLPYIHQIKKAGLIAANYGGDDPVPMVAPADIAAAVADELAMPASGNKIRYVASDEVTCNEAAAVLGAAIGMPDLKWIMVSNEDVVKGMVAAGMAPRIAEGLVEMYASLHEGILSADYYRNRPEVMGVVKLDEYAKEFAAEFAR